jgi:hypothetical protein
MRKTEAGWESRTGVLLTAPCVKCAVWIGKDEKGRKIEFDGMPHRPDCTRGHKSVTLQQSVTT